MISSSLRFQLPFASGILELTPQALTHFDRYKQNKRWSREAGGQLFATFDEPSLIKVVDVTGPRKSDRRSVFGFEPDRVAEKREIAEFFERGLHFIGDWHTHPQSIPSPSSTDERSMREMVKSSSHNLPGFIMVIVGQAEFPQGIHVSFHSRVESIHLHLL